MFDATTAQLHALSEGKAIRSTLDALASLPEEEVWLVSRKSRETRQAYAGDVRCFMRLFGITSPEALRQVDRKVIMAYERHLREVQRLRAYLAAAGHGQHRDGPLFRRLNWSGSEQDRRRPLRPERVEWVVRKYTQQIGLGHGYSSHSMRTTFITTALQNGAKLDDVQRTVGHADPNVFMTGIHVGCYELFAAQPVRTIHDLKGQRVAVTELDAGPHFLFARTLWYVDLDPAKSFSRELAD